MFLKTNRTNIINEKKNNYKLIYICRHEYQPIKYLRDKVSKASRKDRLR